MEKHISGLLVTIAVLALLVGGLVGYNMAPVKVVTETETEYVTQNVSVPVFIEAPIVLDKAVEVFLEAVDDEEDEAGNDINVLGSYDFDEVEVSKIYDEWSVEYDDDKTTVDFSIKLRFDEDGEASEKETFDVTVYFEKGEDTEVIVA